MGRPWSREERGLRAGRGGTPPVSGPQASYKPLYYIISWCYVGGWIKTRPYLQRHLAHKDSRKDIVGHGEEDAFLEEPGGTVGPRAPPHNCPATCSADPVYPLQSKLPGAHALPLGLALHPAATHGAASLNLRPLQGDGDAVEEDEGQDDVVKELVGDDSLTQDPEPRQGQAGATERGSASCPGSGP